MILERIKEKYNKRYLEKISRPTRRRKKLKVGLALGGGGTKGFAHLGALKAFDENNIYFDFVSGTSIGSLIGALYCQGLGFSEIYEIATNITMKNFTTSKIPFITNSTDKIQELVQEYIPHNTFGGLKTEFACVAVDLKTGNEIVFKEGDLKKSIAGSCCVPGFFTPVAYEDYLLIDGGIRNLLPADVCKKRDCDYVVSISLSKGGNIGTDSSNIISVLTTSMKIMMKNIKEKGISYSDIVIQPNMNKFNFLSTKGAQEMFDEGYKSALSRIEEIKKAINNK